MRSEGGGVGRRKRLPHNRGWAMSLRGSLECYGEIAWLAGPSHGCSGVTWRRHSCPMPLSFRSRSLTGTFFGTYVSTRKSGQRLAACGLHAKWPTRLPATQGGELTPKAGPMESICCRPDRKLSGIGHSCLPRRHSCRRSATALCRTRERVSRRVSTRQTGVSAPHRRVGYEICRLAAPSRSRLVRVLWSRDRKGAVGSYRL